MPHELMYAQIKAGPGPDGAIPAMASYQKAAAVMLAVGEQLKQTLALLSHDWTGPAATTASVAIEGITTRSDALSRVLEQTKQIIDREITAFSYARDAMPEPLPSQKHELVLSGRSGLAGR